METATTAELMIIAVAATETFDTMSNQPLTESEIYTLLATGRTSLLEATTRRLAGIVDDRRTVLLLSSSHRRFYEDIGRSRPSSLLVEQPANQGTAVGMAFALGRIRQTDRHAVVGFFPSDHHYAHVSAFHEATSTAYRIAAQHPDRLVLIRESRAAVCRQMSHRPSSPLRRAIMARVQRLHRACLPLPHRPRQT